MCMILSTVWAHAVQQHSMRHDAIIIIKGSVCAYVFVEHVEVGVWWMGLDY